MPNRYRKYYRKNRKRYVWNPIDSTNISTHPYLQTELLKKIETSTVPDRQLKTEGQMAKVTLVYVSEFKPPIPQGP